MTALLVGCGVERPDGWGGPGGGDGRPPITFVDGGPGGDRGIVIPGVDAGAPQPDAWVPPPGTDATVPPPQPDAGGVGPDTGGPGPGDYDFTAHLTFTTISKRSASCNTASYGEYYCDVWLHTQGPYTGADTLTNIHESQHFMAHEHDSSTAAADKFIYFRDGKGAFFPEPQMVTSGIYSAIKVQGKGYNTYIAGRPSQALGENIVDEWRAYLTEEIVAIQMAQINGQQSVSGLIIGGVEFLYYSAAMLHALKTSEPSYLAAHPEGPAIFAMMAEEVKAWTIDKGVVPGLFTGSSDAAAILTALRTGADNAPIRATLVELFGAAWTQRVLGF